MISLLGSVPLLSWWVEGRWKSYNIRRFRIQALETNLTHYFLMSH